MAGWSGKIVLISGASSGIGAELARELGRRGAKLGLIARRTERLQELADELEDVTEVAWQAADVCDDDGLSAALDGLAEALGGVDVIVANAGYGHPEPPHRFQAGDSIRMYDTNVLGMLRMIDWALPRFLAQGSGHIVGVASMASYLGLANMASYCGTKAAMRVHLQGLRVGLAAYGIAVTTICPGFVDSELTAKHQTPMPFFWPTDRAVRLIADAIEKRRGEVAFPWQMRLLLGFFSRCLPTSWTEALLRKQAPKPRPLQGRPTSTTKP